MKLLSDIFTLANLLVQLILSVVAMAIGLASMALALACMAVVLIPFILLLSFVF